jgi:hypothetical protein
MDDASAWNGNWAWSLSLVVITVLFHVMDWGCSTRRWRTSSRS